MRLAGREAAVERLLGHRSAAAGRAPSCWPACCAPEWLAASMNISDAFLGARQRHQVGGDEVQRMPAGSISRRCRKLLPGSTSRYSCEHVGAAGLDAGRSRRLRMPACSSENMISPLLRTTGLFVAGVHRDPLMAPSFCPGCAAAAPLALVFVERVNGLAAFCTVLVRPWRLTENTGLPGSRLGRRRRRWSRRSGGAASPPVSPPVLMSYSQMFQRPVQAGAPSMVAGLVAGQLHREDDLLPSYDTSGPTRRRWPLGVARELRSGCAPARWARLLAQDQVAARREGRAVGRVDGHRRRALGIDDGHVALDRDRAVAGAAAGTAGEHGRRRLRLQPRTPRCGPVCA